jgi:hypothetical protein
MRSVWLSLPLVDPEEEFGIDCERLEDRFWLNHRKRDIAKSRAASDTISSCLQGHYDKIILKSDMSEPIS